MGTIFIHPTTFSMTRLWWRCLHKGSEFWVGLDRRLPLEDCKVRCLRHCFGKCRTSCCKNPSSGSTPISSHWSWARFGGWLGTEIKINRENPWPQKKLSSKHCFTDPRWFFEAFSEPEAWDPVKSLKIDWSQADLWPFFSVLPVLRDSNVLTGDGLTEQFSPMQARSIPNFLWFTSNVPA